MPHSFFQNAHHFVANTDTLISAQSYHVHNGGGPSQAFQLLQENTSEGAMHNSDDRCNPPMCHPETRKAVQEDIFSFITHGHEEAEPKKILWMSGPAGCGKTAIAGTISEECDARGLLVASFFCSSFAGSHKRRSKRFVIPTLAYQLMQNDGTGAMRKAILSSIENDPIILQKRLKDQCRVLLLQPLQQLRDQGLLPSAHQVIVIDGLDEIESDNSRSIERQQALEENEQDQVEILSAILQAVSHPIFPFRVAIFSRPEHGIREFFLGQSARNITLELFLDDKYGPDDDIEVFLTSKFAEIRRRYHLSPSWPSQDVVKGLVYKASGQFIYVATIIRFLQDRSNTPPNQLERVLRLWSAEAPTRNPFAALDALYTQILKSSPDPDLAAEWIVALGNSWGRLTEVPPSYVRQLLERRPGEVEHLLGSLSSLVHSPTSDDEPYQVYHRSLVDFLLDSERGQRTFPRALDSEQLVRRSYLQVLLRKVPRITLAKPELETFLDHFVENTDGWIAVVLLDGPDRLYTHNALADCDASWWIQTIVRLDPDSASHHISELFKHVHNDCEVDDYYDDGEGCKLSCLNWRGAILEFCRANGWTVPRDALMHDDDTEGPGLRPPGRTVAHLLW